MMTMNTLEDKAAKPAKAIAQRPPELPSETTAIIQMIERAARDPAVDIDKMRDLMAMRKEMIADEAKRAYAGAFAMMQAELPIIVERGEIKIGNSKGQGYALWEDINEAIKPVLQRHGFGLSFRTGQTDNKIVVTGILSHKDGHSEETTMHLPVDASGSKNAVQAVGSSTSYGKRYTASALLNLTSRNQDDDGKGAGDGEYISEEQVISIRELIESVGANEKKFLAYIKVESLATIPVKQYQGALDALNAKKAKQ